MGGAHAPPRQFPYHGLPAWVYTWILTGERPGLRPVNERIRTRPGFVRISDRDGYRLEAVAPKTETITIKGKGHDGRSQSGRASRADGRPSSVEERGAERAASGEEGASPGEA